MPFSPQGGNGTVLAPSDVVAGSANFEDALYHCIERNCPNIKLQNMLFAKKWTPNSICLLFLQYCLLALTNLLSCFKIVGNITSFS